MANVDYFSLAMTCLIVLAAVVLAGIAAILVSARSRTKRPPQKVYKVRVEGAKVFSEIDMSQVEQYARTQLQQSATRAAEQLQATLGNTVQQISSHLSDLATNDLSQEFEKYRVSLEALRNESIHEFGKLEKELSDKRTERLAELDKQVATEYERRMTAFNERLNDVVASYLLEALGDQVDLGAQTNYIFGVLQQHKDDIKRDVAA